MKFWKRFGQPVVFVQKVGLALFISPLNGFQALFLFPSEWTLGQIPKRVARPPDIGVDVAWRIDNGRCV